MSFPLDPSELRTAVVALTTGLMALLIGTDELAVAPTATEFSARDVGEYAAVPWGDPNQPIIAGSRQDRVRDLNMTVASVTLTDEIQDDELDYWAQIANWGQEQNKKLLLRLYFWDGADRYQGPMRDTDVYWNRLDQFLQGMQARESLVDCWGVVLAEENVFYSGRPEVLTELYQRIKAKYDVAVWQWWSPMVAIPSSGGWIPADGWVVDPYFLPNPTFRQYIRKYVVAGKPVIVMPWASYNPFDERPPMTPEQWQINHNQLDVAVEFNLPVVFYWTYGYQSGGTTCYFGCDRNNPPSDEIGRINQWVWNHIDRVRALPVDYAGLPSADSAVAGPLAISLDNQTGTMTYQDAFSTQQCIDDATMTGFRDLVMDGQTLSARGFQGRKVAATLTYHFAGSVAVKSPNVSLTATALKTLNGRVQIGVSKDGKTWKWSAAAQKNGLQSLSYTSSAVANVQEFWVRIQLSGDAGSSDTPPVRIDNLKIQAQSQRRTR